MAGRAQKAVDRAVDKPQGPLGPHGPQGPDTLYPRACFTSVLALAKSMRPG